MRIAYARPDRAAFARSVLRNHGIASTLTPGLPRPGGRVYHVVVVARGDATRAADVLDRRGLVGRVLRSRR